MSTSDVTSKLGMVWPPGYRRCWMPGRRAAEMLGARHRRSWRYARRLLGRCPSGQRERAVNPSALPSEVQILPGPPVLLGARCGSLPLRPCAERSMHAGHTIGERRFPDPAEPIDPRPRCGCGTLAGATLSSARSTGLAPLAQSAERLHGKEKVESSILSGSSRRRHCLRRFTFARHRERGGVAQLVRALDS